MIINRPRRLCNSDTLRRTAGETRLSPERVQCCERAVSIYRAGADILISYYAKEIAATIERGDIG